MSYTPTTWIDGETPVNAENLNRLEEGVANADEKATAAVKTVKGIAPDENGNVDFPTDEYINALIDAKLGVIENGSY